MKHTKAYVVLLPIEVELGSTEMRRWHRVRVMARMKTRGKTDLVSTFNKKLGRMMLPMRWLYMAPIQ